MERIEDAVALELTFTRRHALNPLMIHFFVEGSPTVLKPSTARSTTTFPTGFLEPAAFTARHCFIDCWTKAWRAD